MEDLRVALEEIREESESGTAARPTPPPAAGKTREKWIGAAVALALLALAVAATWKRGTANAVREGLETVQVTTVPGLAIGASFSPDGKQIAFSSNRNGWFEIYTKSSEGAGSDHQITTDGKQAVEPAWSPDGKWIAYHSVAEHGLWVVPAGGGTPRQISKFGSAPSWSPDSRALAFRSYETSSLALSDWPGDGESTIWTVAADGTNLQQLTQPRNPPGQHADPSWSPDGRRLIFASLAIVTMGFRGVLFTVDVKSSEVKPVPAGGIWGAANPVFAADGKGVYFAGRPDLAGFNGVYYSDLSEGAKPVELIRTRQAVPARITLSRDGKSLAFTRLVNASQIWITETSGKESKALYQDLVVRARVPNYSPDGTRLNYQVQSDDSTLGIWVMNADGSNPMRVAPDLGNSNGANWSSDGNALVCAFFGGGKSRFIWISLTDGSRKVLQEVPRDLLRSHLTPDEKEFVYDYGSPRNIWKRPVAGGPPKQLTFGRTRNWFPEVSWDGNWIAYEVTEGDNTEIAVMDRDGGQQRILTSGPGKRFPHSFASDNRRIAYAGFENGAWNLYWIDRITGEHKQVTHYTAFGSFVRSPAWRPGTEQIAYEYSDVKGNIERLQLR
jgi:Tol biopolymer transport system component